MRTDEAMKVETIVAVKDAEIARLRAAFNEHDKWLAKAADALNISSRMLDMDLGSKITEYRRDQQAADEQTAGENKP